MTERAPYKYLDYYTFEDADIFFGREEETQKMVGEILSTRLLVLFSPSGSGKTSLINAGVRPALENLGYKTVYVRLESDPIPSVKNAVAQACDLRSADENDDLHSFLKNATRQGAAEISLQHDNQPLVIFIDQFEEFFIVFKNKTETQRTFIEQVAKIKYDDQLPVFLVLSLREDYFANLHEFREAIPSIFQNNANLRLEPFTEAEARRAIEEPAKVVGCEYEAGLVERMLQDLKNGQSGIEPITLQIVCDAVWQEKPANATQITGAEYKASGGAKHILQNYVSCLLDRLPLRQQSLMAEIFEALKTPDDTKRYRSFSDLRENLKIGAKSLQAALKKLAGLSLLRHEERAGDHWYEFKHDYLVREIAAWLQGRRERLAKRRLWYGLSPGVALLLGLLVYLFVQYNSFYAGTVAPENVSFQQEEIAIFRDNPFHQTVATTGYLLSEVRSDSMKRVLKNHLKLSFQKDQDWNWLVMTLHKVEAVKTAYLLGNNKVALEALLDALKDSNWNVRRQAAAALGNLLKPKLETELLKFLSNNLSGYRTAGVQALARQDSLLPALLSRIDQLRQNKNPWWVRLAASDAYELIQDRLKSEAEARQLLHQADSVFASNQFSVASDQYEAAFDILKGIIRVDSVKIARAKFQQARCAAKLKRIVPALDDLKMALEYNPTWRETLQAEMAQPNNDWAILQGNWYLREVLLKNTKIAPK